MKVRAFQHQQALQSALRRLIKSPLNTLLNTLVISIALALPTAAYLALDNLRELAAGFSGIQQISVFLDQEAGDKEAADIEAQLKALPDVGKLRFVSRTDALTRLQENQGLQDIVASLPSNPLPHAFIVEPRSTAPADMEALSQRLATLPRVAHVQLDSSWIKRLDALLRIGRLAVGALALVLGIALVAVTFNTIRLQILTQQDEIEVSRLIGATDGFIRRPFYYAGAFQGLVGGALAWALAYLTTYLASAPLTELLQLYGTPFAIHGLRPLDSAILLSFAAALGWLGAHLSVFLHLRSIDAP